MRSNNLVKTDTPITFIIPSNVPDEYINTWVYVTGDTKDVLSRTITTKGNFKYVTLSTPKYDCYIFFKYFDQAEFVRVGTPPVHLMVHYLKYKIDEVVDYVQYDYDSTELNTGPLTDIGDGFYVAGTISVVKSFYIVVGAIITLTLPEQYYAICDISSGSILLERGNWQLIVLPKAGKVYEDFIVKLEEQTGKNGTDLVEVCSAYPGHINKFLSYIPGFTSSSSEHNFSLYYTDEGIKEFTGFWVKCKEWTHSTDNITFNY